jgi:hypothetical protein
MNTIQANPSSEHSSLQRLFQEAMESALQVSPDKVDLPDKSKSLDRCESLIQAGADVSHWPLKEREQLLSNAVFLGKKHTVLALLACGTPVNSKPEMGNVFVRQLKNFDEEIFHALVQSGADIDARCGMSLFQSACEIGHLPLLECLIRAGAKRNEKDVIGRCPLHIAAAAGKTDVCILLLQNGAQINALSSSRMSAAFHAANSGQTTTGIALIQVGSDPHEKVRGQSLAAHARDRSHEETARAIEAYMASLKAAQTIDDMIADCNKGAPGPRSG